MLTLFFLPALPSPTKVNAIHLSRPSSSAPFPPILIMPLFLIYVETKRVHPSFLLHCETRQYFKKPSHVMTAHIRKFERQKIKSQFKISFEEGEIGGLIIQLAELL